MLVVVLLPVDAQVQELLVDHHDLVVLQREGFAVHEQLQSLQLVDDQSLSVKLVLFDLIEVSPKQIVVHRILASLLGP